METHREKIIRRAGLIVSFNYGLLAAKKKLDDKRLEPAQQRGI
jgi:hypothetical protein